MQRIINFSVLVIIIITSTFTSSSAQISWTKDANNPVLSGGASGTWNRHVFWPSVLYNPDSSRYEMWFSAAAQAGIRPYNIGFATSHDGITWTKIDTAVLKPDAGSWDQSTTEGATVIRENGQYKMWYLGWSPSNPVGGFGYAASTNGTTWIKHTNNPVMYPSLAAWESGGFGSCSVLPVPGGYKMWYDGYTADFSNSNIGLATSPDGIAWTLDSLHNPVINTGSTGSWDDGNLELPRVLFFNNLYHIWFTGMRPAETLPWQMGWATSFDGIYWNKYNNPATTSQLYSNSDPVLGPSSGQWDGTHFLSGAVILEGDSLLRMWYSGSRSPIGTNLFRIGHATAPVILNVPGNYSTIQSAIDIAAEGNLILVADGTYQENINFKGKAITVASHYYIDGDTSHISNTIIDGSSPTNADSGSVVYFTSGEDTNSVLCGLTITGGTGTLIGNGTRHGGGIFVFNSTALIKNNNIEFNIINHPTDVFGGGIYAGYHNNKNLIIDNNLIRNNSIISTNVVNYCLGAGIYSWADGTETVRISNNRIINNTITAPVTYGGGITPANDGNANYIITHNIIKGNTINASAGASGGIDIIDHFPILWNNLLVNNSAPVGGGMAIEYTTVKSNISDARGSNSINNGHKTTTAEFANFSNNTIVGNYATNSGGGITIIGGTVPQLMNFIVWDNSAPSDSQISGNANVQYSDIESGYGDTTNIDTNPLFADTISYYLSASSPCIDAGNPDFSYNEPEDPNNPGFALWPAQGTIRSDMGAYGSDPNITGIESIENTYNLPNNFALKQNYPNPFNPSTTIEFTIPKSEFVTLKIYNLLGQEVASLVNQKLTHGNYKYSWDASSFASGIYYLKLQIDKHFIQSMKLVLLK